MQPEGDFDQIRRLVFESARRLLHSRRAEQPPVSTGDIAGDVGLELPLVVKAVQSLADTHLRVRRGDDWKLAEIAAVEQEP
jgi:hypothetical protein